MDNISFEEPLSTSDELLQRSVDYTVTNTVTQAVTISEMKDSLCHLQLELASTQNELESYIIENNGLRSLNAKLTIENDTLKKLCLSPLKDNCIIRNTPSKFHTHKKENKIQNDQLTLEKQITVLKQQLSVAESEIQSLTKQIRNLEEKLHGGEATSQLMSSFTSSSTVQEDCKNRLLIYGAQKCTGLASALIHSRKDSMYERYQVTGQIKPNALTSDILKDVNTKLKPNDKLIICIGENDYDMKLLLLQFRKFVNKYKNNEIIVLNVFRNLYLNVSDLNYNLCNLCKGYENCHFITSNGKNLADICKSINYTVDCIDYNKKYLDVKELKKIITINNNLSAKHKSNPKLVKGTIPYYFASVRSKCESVISETDKQMPQKKKKYITDYFPLLSGTQFFRTKKS